jgi:hypothetical protein
LTEEIVLVEKEGTRNSTPVVQQPHASRMETPNINLPVTPKKDIPVTPKKDGHVTPNSVHDVEKLAEVSPRQENLEKNVRDAVGLGIDASEGSIAEGEFGKDT